MSKPSTNGYPTIPTDMTLLGEIITWSAGGTKVQHIDLVNALRGAELEESVARELAPRHAFTRACRKLAQARIIRQVEENSSAITFQFTAERKDGDHFEYELETLLTLDKTSGKVSCKLSSLATLAQEELDRCIEARTGNDVTRIVQRLFERKADLFPIRPAGGAYFVPQEHTEFIDRVQSFLGKINGELLRFPVPSGTREGDRSVKEAVATGIASLIDEHRQAIAAFGADTRDATLQRAAERIRQVKYKVEAYSAYLAEERSRLDRSLAEAATELRTKVVQLAADLEAPLAGVR
jgi:uncharacterized protein DUF6744